MKKTAIMIDGGHLRSYVKPKKQKYNPDYIEKIAHSCIDPTKEEIYRILHYDCRQFSGTVTLPVSGEKKVFNGNDKWLHDLSQKNHFAVRLGVLKFRGWVLRKTPLEIANAQELKDEDFSPKLEQKGVDMRIGLDMALFSENKAIDIIALITNDTDCVPAMKHARRAGLQVALIIIPDYRPSPELLAHSDFVRHIDWPKEI